MEAYQGGKMMDSLEASLVSFLDELEAASTSSDAEPVNVLAHESRLKGELGALRRHLQSQQLSHAVQLGLEQGGDNLTQLVDQLHVLSHEQAACDEQLRLAKARAAEASKIITER